MATYIKHSCPKCHTAIDGWDLRRYSFGPPFVVCPKCQQLLKRSDYINEWELMNSRQRYTFQLAAVWTIIVYGVGGGLMLCAIAGISGIGGLSTSYFEQYPVILGAAVAVTLSVSAYKVFRDFNKSRRESLRRTMDPVYREKLKNLGFIK